MLHVAIQSCMNKDIHNTYAASLGLVTNPCGKSIRRFLQTNSSIDLRAHVAPDRASSS
jgi:hypothetical protein